MAVHSWVSGKEIMARVIRALNGKLPAEYQDSILEWIPNAMKMMNTVHNVERTSTPNRGCAGELISSNHTLCMPHGIVNLIAVEDEFGRRVPKGMDQTNLKNIPPSTRFHSGSQNASNFLPRSTNFQMDAIDTEGVNPYGIDSTQTAVPYDGSDIKPLTSSNSALYYLINGPYMQTSDEIMFVKLHYDRILVDNEGYPMIPDNENYKQAATWFVIRELIAAGYEHKIFKGESGWNHCDRHWRDRQRVALGEITYPSIDQMENLRRLVERIIPPRHFYDDFFIGGEQTQFINHI